MGIQVKIGGEIKGPFEAPEIQEMVAAGSVKPTDQAREEGKKKWAPLQVVIPELASSASPEPKTAARAWDTVQSQAQQWALQLRSGFGGDKILNGIVLVRFGAGLYVAIMILHLFALLYYLGFLPWHVLCLVVQIAIAAPLFFRGKTAKFPFAVSLILVVYLLGGSGRLGIQSVREYWDADAATSRNASTPAKNPRIQSLERERKKLDDQLRLWEEKLELRLQSARLKVDGKEKQAKAVEEEASKLKLSDEKRDELAARINLNNYKVLRRKRTDLYDAESLKNIEVTSVLLYIGVILSACGAWNVHEETS
ncbi:MAG: GYF domain-containing protein [Verrucomicrobiota bacterium]|jgi:hypothetical protein|nr:GYF domain-containing protein [Verrucomicrobiota bacterium]